MGVDLASEGGAPAVVAPVVKEVTVPLDRQRAFTLFTRRIAEWWPLATHSVEGDEAVACVFEERVGGRLYERARDGSEHTWGTVLEWDPPAGFSMTWHPGRDASSAQQLRVSFIEADDRTLVRLVHSGWERLADGGTAERANYDLGWDYVLGFFTRAATA